MKVAWIGMGRIGKAMALRVLAAGHDLVGHARTPETQREIEAAGGRLTGLLGEAVADAEVVCVNVYDEIQLRDALLTGGALAAMRSGAVLVIHSTVGPAIIRELAQARGDIKVIDAPFSGTDKSAAGGTIALMVGGDGAALKEARPVLACYANFIEHVGPLGAGALIKLVNNALFGAQMLLAHDAIRILSEGGIDQQCAVTSLGRSSGGSFALQQFAQGGDADARLTGVWPYMQKDVAAARTALADLRIDLGLLDITTRRFINA
ncbi:MAG: hypothetical protein RIQ99_2 [Pseudomonadota bacterium]